MPGLGKYKKGKKFELKSGNNPAFKMMGTPESGDSPITKGSSPYLEEEEDDKKGGKGKKLAQIALASITSGLDAVYGTGKIMPKGVKFSDEDEEGKEDE